ncbi:MAG: ABC transporter permease [Defluviitaleaceae bacterium]|nr:ABC transporter permease [Defluviitaleaceae bacterium]MCL2276163.1 ABC transporter permease [Defluviitaleaceae bacterium]
MTAKSFSKTMQMIVKLYIRDFASPFFSVVFPLGAILLFGSIYGNEPGELFNYRLGAMDVMVPALVGMVIAVNGIMTLPLNLTEFMTNKVYKRFDATPMGKENIIFVQVFVYLLAVLVSAAIVIVVGWLIYDINIDGNWLVIIPALLLSCLAIFAMGFFIAAVFKSGKIAQVVSYIVYFLMIFLSGATMPLEIMPDNIRTFANILPLTHVVNLLQGTFHGQAISEQMTAIVVLAGLSAVCGSIGAVMYNRRKWA